MSNDEVKDEVLSEASSGEDAEPPSPAETLLQQPRPCDIVAALDRYVIGQADAKRAVAIALRNRWRRQQVPEPLREEIAPKNIIMIGPTGVGKTELARRLAKLAAAPFIKVEATKFTEVGYVGRDVEAMIRDLVEQAVGMVRQEEQDRVIARAESQAEEQLLDLLGAHDANREQMRQELRAGELDEREVDVEVRNERGLGDVKMVFGRGLEDVRGSLGNMLGDMFTQQHSSRRTVPEARAHLTAECTSAIIDMDKVVREALRRVEQAGIVFIDEIDKVAQKSGARGPDVSREGVQRDILPIVEGSTVSTKHGHVKTDHILFIAAGAFHVSKPSDLIPELQGRFPIRVELHSLDKEHFVRILSEPEASLVRQYTALLATEGVTIDFADEAIEAVAAVAAQVNESAENIGARRLHTVMEKLLDDVSFNAPDLQGRTIAITAEYVHERLADVAEDQDLSRYIL